MDKIYAALQDVGVQASLKGFDDLHDAIMLLNGDATYKGSFVGRLYPDVAKLSASRDGEEARWEQVERRMRHAIGKAIDRVDEETLRKYFGRAFSKSNGVSVSEFIAALALHCKEEAE